jgi:peptidoglycan hydrolase-like protein with peptidoglycan-binding domain
MFKINDPDNGEPGIGVNFYKNSVPVGTGADNRSREEILLVQFFLRDFFFGEPGLFKQLPKTKKGGNLVAVDGTVGSQTIAAIRAFQKFQKTQTGNTNFQDGRVDVARGRFASDGSSFFTIDILNFEFFGREDNFTFNQTLSTHPDLGSVPELQAALARIDSGGAT